MTFIVFIMYNYSNLIRLFAEHSLMAFWDGLNSVAININSALVMIALFAKRMFGARTGYAAMWVGMV